MEGVGSVEGAGAVTDVVDGTDGAAVRGVDDVSGQPTSRGTQTVGTQSRVTAPGYCAEHPGQLQG
ncbi:MAG: hypothetical protein KC776_22245 [Myxococcales bacterium]|nr:hypothetical protein [Myxococcales bacterium]MCB9575917.1 hypothetical protein [Polyangiaceae bacterium]